MFDAYRGKRVLVTGHTGFKGSWLTLWLHRLGAKVYGIGLLPVGDRSLWEDAGITEIIAGESLFDIRNASAVQRVVAGIKPDVIFHLAAQAIVSEGYANPADTFSTNVMGIVNLLEAIRKSPCPTIIATSDKCYRNDESGEAFRESDPLGGNCPYSASKACAEHVAQAYREAFGMQVATVRAGNVIGGGDWAKDRLIPDIVRAIQAGRSVELRNPGHRRPWQHVLDCLSGYLRLGEGMIVNNRIKGAFNFGPDADSSRTVQNVTGKFIEAFGSGNMTFLCEESREVPSLQISSHKARFDLDWQPRFDTGTAINLTADWYSSYLRGPERAADYCVHDFLAWEARA